jgi:adenosylcobinamide-phosphate synthase
MVGYRDEPYTHLGWFSAKLDDLLTWLPCRLNVITLGAISGKMRTVWKTCQRDARKDPSPNSGWSECAYAAILGVQLGGLNTYQGVLKLKPLLGKPNRPITAERIHYALRLMRNSFVTWTVAATALWAIAGEA